MKKFYFCIGLLLSCFQLLAQTTSDIGYFVDKNGNRTECYFKIFDFSEINTANSVLYFKKNKAEEFTKVDSDDVIEFGIGSEFKYKKVTVMVDDSNLFKNYTDVKGPVFISKTLFLNVIVEGAASLYEFQSDEGYKYFYSILSKGGKPEQLVYKLYKTDQDIVKENTYFREQLFNNVKCGDKLFNDFLALDYKRNNLKKVVEDYNKCNNVQSVAFDNKKFGMSELNFTVFAGPRQSSFVLERSGISEKESNFNYSIGAELEFLPPGKKWTAFASLEYNSGFEADMHPGYTTANGSNHVEDHLVFKTTSVNVLFGPRFYFNRKEFSKFFTDAAFSLNIPTGNIVKTGNITNGTGTFPTETLHADLRSNVYLSLGIGMMYKKISVALRVETNREIFNSKIDGYSGRFSSTYGINLRYRVY